MVPVPADGGKKVVLRSAARARELQLLRQRLEAARMEVEAHKQRLDDAGETKALPKQPRRATARRHPTVGPAWDLLRGKSTGGVNDNSVLVEANAHRL